MVINIEVDDMLHTDQMSDSFRIGAVLALVGGFLDAYTYLFRGQVFANAQTGNIVLMGIQFAEGNWSKAFVYFIPIFAFVIGAVRFKRRKIMIPIYIIFFTLTPCHM